jgi:hypothetical protein
MTLKKKLISVIIIKYLLIILIIPFSNLSAFLIDYKSKGLTISSIETLFNPEPVEGYLSSIIRKFL